MCELIRLSYNSNAVGIIFRKALSPRVGECGEAAHVLITKPMLQKEALQMFPLSV